MLVPLQLALQSLGVETKVSLVCVVETDACPSGNDCSSQSSGFRNMLLCGVADFVLQCFVYFMLFSVNNVLQYYCYDEVMLPWLLLFTMILL